MSHDEVSPTVSNHGEDTLEKDMMTNSLPSSVREDQGEKEDREEDGGSGGSEVEGEEGIAVGFEDISVLRESLECDSIIRKSLVRSPSLLSSLCKMYIIIFLAGFSAVWF